jgi:hypothetical protein
MTTTTKESPSEQAPVTSRVALDEAVIESLPATALKTLLLELRDEDENPQLLAHYSHTSHNQWAP